MTWGIWWTSPEHSKNLIKCALWGAFLTKVYNVWAKKPQRSYVSLHWGVMEYLKKDWWFENDTRNFVNFHASSRNSENFHFSGLLLSMAYKVSVKKYRRVMSNGLEQWSKLWRNIDLLFENSHEELGELGEQWKVWKFALWWASSDISI